MCYSEAMKISVTKKFYFEAAHSLPLHNGKCKGVHGHSYELEVTVSGPVLTEGSSTGMVMDFSDMSLIVEREIVSKWDHRFLNDEVPFVTTAELLAEECFSRLQKSGLSVTKVTLYETRKCSATVEL